VPLTDLAAVVRMTYSSWLYPSSASVHIGSVAKVVIFCDCDLWKLEPKVYQMLYVHVSGCVASLCKL